jgi:K(+)-stimulated pyrophosphate-energized sodium pump
MCLAPTRAEDFLLSSFLTNHGIVVALVCAGCAVVYGLLTTKALLGLSPGNERMRSISQAVQQGATAYLNRQYTTIAGVGVVLFVVLIFLQNIAVAAGFAIGGILSGAAGYIGMNVSVRSNARVAEAARGGVSKALGVAFRGGAITGLLVVGLALLGLSGYFGLLTAVFKDSDKTAVDALVGLSFGGSLISVFARLGGGIFTKAADVGADIVGKIEAGIPEDDPRNPATIADNVGDNVGDCAGMAADLFETYVVTAVAVMLLGVLTFGAAQSTQLALYPLVLGAVAIIASIIGTFAVRTKSGNVERALYQGLIVSGALAAAAFAPITYWMMRSLTFKAGGAAAPSWVHFYLCALIGIGVTAFLFLITDFYTSTRFSPVKKTARASITGHATNIIQGFGSGLQATALPAIVIAMGILGAWKLAGGGTQGIYGIGVAVMGQLSLMGLIVALDAFGPITDNAGGIAEMAELPEEVRNVTDPLDAVGNTTKAVTKGYAIGSAVLAALVLFAGFRQELEAKGAGHLSFSVDNPPVLIGLLLGGLMVCLFASLSIEAVGRAGGAVVEEVRRQFKEHPGIMDGSEQPDYARCVDIVTRTAQREMILPSLLPIALTVIVGVIDTQALGGLLIGVIVVGLFFAVLMTAGGGAWDNAKKLIEDGAFGGKGSEAHAASVTGDTVGDPFKDTAGPAINPMIKVANIVAILIIPLIK